MTWRNLCLFLLVSAVVGSTARAAQTNDYFPPPDFGGEIGTLVPSHRHSYVEDVHANIPLFHIDPLTLIYRYHETTPFLRKNAQAQLFYTRYDFEADLRLCDEARVILVSGYRRTQLEDRPGMLGAFIVGAGVGSPVKRELDYFEWSVVAGGYLSRNNLPADWWMDLHAVGRIWRGGEMKMYDTVFHPTLGLAGDIESANEGGQFHALYKVGPILDFMSLNGNRLRFEAKWYHTDGQPFYQDNENALLLGVEISAALDEDKLFDARDQRVTGWLPLVWGDYDIGYGNARTVQRFELDSEVHDFLIGEHRITMTLDYESRQELRRDDYSNISYTVAPGIETPIGLESFLSQGQPLVAGIDYEHRSSHALNPSPTRVAPGTFLERDSLNILPRLRLQTLGWDLPYRDPTMYEKKTEWLNHFDWRVTLGYDFHHSRSRSNPAGQIGLNWDAVTVRGSVLYLRGIGSIGNETPDWLLECGVRRHRGKLFVRAEEYGLEQHLAHGYTLVAGLGITL